MSAKVSKFISELVVHYGEPKFDVSEAERPKAHNAWLKDMVRALDGYSSDALQKASEIVKTTRKRRDFPLLSECKEAAYEADRFLKSQAPKLHEQSRAKSLPEWSEERERLADELVMTELGRRAAREGWILALHNFCRKNMKLPTEKWEIANLIAEAKGFDTAYENCIRRECGPLSMHLEKLGTSMLARRKSLSDMVLHGVLR